MERNYVTEAEAAGKWCPLARTWAPAGSPAEGQNEPIASGVNRTLHGSPDDGALCLGSACMFWRWYDATARLNYERHRGPRPPDDRPEWVEVSWETDRTLAEVQEQEILDEESAEDLAITQGRYRWHRRLPDLPPRGYCGSVRK